ncbi:MAG: cytochrome c1 [Ectothiorhodospira sp.]
MKKILTFSLLTMILGAPGLALSAGGGAHLEDANIDLTDKDSIERGAEYFFDYCIGCHSLEYERYTTITEGLDLSEDEVTERFIHTRDEKGMPSAVGSLIKIAMRPEDAEEWFAQPAPDLTLTARQRGADWIYSMLKGFYLDDETTFGVNNRVFEDMGMPHVLWELQGWQENVGEGDDVELELKEEGRMSTEEYDDMVRDITAFMTYMGEPERLERERLGVWALGFLVIFTLLAYLLKKEYWRDVH